MQKLLKYIYILFICFVCLKPPQTMRERQKKGTVKRFGCSKQWVAHRFDFPMSPFLGNATFYILNLLHLSQQENKKQDGFSNY